MKLKMARKRDFESQENSIRRRRETGAREQMRDLKLNTISF